MGEATLEVMMIGARVIKPVAVVVKRARHETSLDGTRKEPSFVRITITGASGDGLEGDRRKRRRTLERGCSVDVAVRVVERSGEGSRGVGADGGAGDGTEHGGGGLFQL